MSDDKTNVELTLTDEEWYTLMKMAHEKDITLNQMVEQILWDAIKHIEEDNHESSSNERRTP